MIKTIYFVPAAYFGNVKEFQLMERLTRLFEDHGLIVVHNVEEAQLIIAFGDSLTPNDAYKGKKVYLADEEKAFDAPKEVLEKALKECKPYEDYLK